MVDTTQVTPPEHITLDDLVSPEQQAEILAAHAELAALAEPLHRACIRAWRAARPVVEIVVRAIEETVALDNWTGVRDTDRLVDRMIADLTGVNGDYTPVSQPEWMRDERVALGLPPSEWDAGQ